MFSNCIALLLSSLTGGNVLSVSPTGPYTQIQDAVDAANDGDLVLVQSGTYGSFTVQGMSLTVVADTNATVTLQGGVSVLDLAAGQTVALIGLHALGDSIWPFTMPSGLHAEQNLGSLRCERCQFFAQVDGADAALIQSSSDVSLVGCQLTGSISTAENTYGNSAARVEGSTVTFFDSTLHGGDGWDSTTQIQPSGNGGEALHAENSTIFSSGSAFFGGNGGAGVFFPIVEILAPEPGFGGPGIELVSGSLMRSLDSTVHGGAFGDPFYPWPAPDVIGSTYTTLTGARRTMTSANPVRELTPLAFTFHGAASESVYLLVGKDTGVQWDPTRNANFLIAPPSYRSLHVGTTDVNGNLIVQLPLGDLGSGVQSDMFYLQPLFVGASGAQQLGTPISLAALDQAY